MKVQQAHKRYALSRGQMACVGDIATINIARGCAGRCVFCYARCYPGAPPSDTLLLYRDLPQQLRRELESPHRKSPLPAYVLLSTASDAFLGGLDILRITHPCLEILLNRRIGVSFSTRGLIPEDTIALLGRHARHVRIFIPLVSLSDAYTRAWEPGAALPHERLFLVRRLLRAGIRPRLRLEPVIPMVNDDSEALRALFSAVRGLGLKTLVVSFLHLRPGVAEQLRAEAPPEGAIVIGGFPTQSDRPDRFHHLPAKQRERSFQRILRLAEEHDLRAVACHCQNPGLPGTQCPIAPPELPVPIGQQSRLF